MLDAICLLHFRANQASSSFPVHVRIAFLPSISFNSRKAERNVRIGFGIDFSALSANSSFTDGVGFSQEVEPLRKCHAHTALLCWITCRFREVTAIYIMFRRSEKFYCKRKKQLGALPALMIDCNRDKILLLRK